MQINISTALVTFFKRYNETSRLALYQALMTELVSIRIQADSLESAQALNSLKHKFKGICRYLNLDLDADIDVITNVAILLDGVNDIYQQVIDFKDEL